MLKIKTEDIVRISKALSDKNRVEIIKLLNDEELCACHLLEFFDFTQPALSHHMKQLVDSGLVIVEKKAQWSYYKINKIVFDEFKEFIENVSSSEYDEKFDGDSCCKE